MTSAIGTVVVLFGAVVAIGVDPSVATPSNPPPPDPVGIVWSDPSYALPSDDSRLPSRPNAVGAPLAVPSNAGRYVAVSPSRVLDSRIGLGTGGILGTGDTVALKVAGVGVVPGGANAIVVNLTATTSAGAGYISVFPAGQARPEVSAINVERVDQTIANLVTIPIGVDGAIHFYASVGVHLIADVQGYYVPSGATSAGRLFPMAPVRVVDTRGSGPLVGPLTAGRDVEIDIAGLGGLPRDADSAVLKVTVTAAAGPGYWSLYPSGSIRPNTSNLNIEYAGQTMAAQALVRLTAGKLNVFAEAGGHLIIDLVGYYTGATAPVGMAGLFVPVAPGRVLDTRQGYQRPGARRAVEVPVAGRFGVPTSGVAAVVLNTTVADAAPGYISVWPARQYRPNASSLNATAIGQTIASHVITPVTTAGFAVFTENGAHLLADISGWFVGDPMSTNVGAHVPLPGPFGPELSSQYNFMMQFTSGGGWQSGADRQDGDVPVRWNPCRPIRYVVNLGGYDMKYLADLSEALDRLTAATGLTFEYVGSSSHMPTYDRSTDLSRTQRLTRTGPYDLLIALGSERTTDLVGWGVLGIAGPSMTTLNGTYQLVEGAAVFNMDELDRRERWGGSGIGVVMLHELAHVVGLAHAFDPAQLMYPSAGAVTAYGPGDLRGLWELGAAQGCVGS